MAGGRIYLRPSADVSLGHTLYPEGNANAYSLINEEVADDESTYISVEGPGNVAASATSKFSLTGTIPAGKINISSASLGIYCNTGSVKHNPITATVSLGGNSETKEIALPTTALTWQDKSASFLDLISNAVLSGGAQILNTIEVSVSTGWDASDSKSSDTSIKITRICLVIEYTDITGLNIHRKVSGGWKQGQKAYQKQNGAWVEITEDECKHVLQNNLCIQG